MKNLSGLTVVVFLLTWSVETNAQSAGTADNQITKDFRYNVSGTIGFLGTTKVRMQFEIPVKKRSSTGVNINYQLNRWTGPVFEPFIRVYGKRYGNIKGIFGQFKLIYGNLKTIEEPYPYAFSNKRWSTRGFGINLGYKILFNNNFTIESLTGFRLLSKPVYKYNPGYSDECREMQKGYEYDWVFLTGFPVDFQVKFGFQF